MTNMLYVVSNIYMKNENEIQRYNKIQDIGGENELKENEIQRESTYQCHV